MNRDYINWLETLPCNRKRQPINTWMGGWAPLPEEIDLSSYKRSDVSHAALGQMVRANAVSFRLSKETSPLRRV